MTDDEVQCWLENRFFKKYENTNYTEEEFIRIKKKECIIHSIEDGEIIMYHCLHCKIDDELDFYDNFDPIDHI